MTISKRYGVFIIRIWHEPAGEDKSVWRASVLNTVTKERNYFATEQELVAFLGLSHPDEKGQLLKGNIDA